MQFLNTLEENIAKISGPVRVFIPTGGITDGSVNVKLSVVFLNGETDSAKAYKSALTGDNASSVYGTYDAYVDPRTFATETTANPTTASPSQGKNWTHVMRNVCTQLCRASLSHHLPFVESSDVLMRYQVTRKWFDEQ